MRTATAARLLSATAALALAAPVVLAASPAAADGASPAPLTILHAAPESAAPGADLALDAGVATTCRVPRTSVMTGCGWIEVSVEYLSADGREVRSTTVDPQGGVAHLVIPGEDVAPGLRYRITATQVMCDGLTFHPDCNQYSAATDEHDVRVR